MTNCPFLAFFSDFDWRAGFPAAVAARLREALPKPGRLAFIASDPARHQKIDQISQGYCRWFREASISFAEVSRIDSRIPPAQARELAARADCLFLLGGPPRTQREFLRDTGLDEILRASRAAVNMGSRSLSIEDGKSFWYEGLGLADLTVRPHFDSGNAATLAALRSASMDGPILALADESALFLTSEGLSAVGAVRRIEGGEVFDIAERRGG
ncbi:MAG: hypothetical protein LBJ11_09445 [Oscillospiraceae bacterium]|jgi:hypothetical protein|nr:hypothetical protein [Oscillospiraceae bacterium]